MEGNIVDNNLHNCSLLVMTYETLFERLGGLAFFDLATVVQLFDEPRASIRMQLHRWSGREKLLSLRRGMYAWPESHRRAPLNPAVLANALHAPSYLSGLWALSFYGLIPERVMTYTSVTQRGPRKFENAAGRFEYRHVKQGAFFGYQGVQMEGGKAQVALPEKALLDFWHLSKGAWTMERMAEMRFQNVDAVKPRRLLRFARQYGSRRLLGAAEVWRDTAQDARKGTKTL